MSRVNVTKVHNPLLKGLSPRVRGNLRLCWRRLRLTRSIPVCAGEPTTCFLRALPMRVYPRVCGGTM